MNPQINEEELKQVKDLLRRLRQVGTVKRSYNLANPYDNRNKSLFKKENLDPRTVQLGRSPQR